MHRKHTVEMRDMERWVVGGEGGEGGREKGREERERGEGKVVLSNHSLSFSSSFWLLSSVE